MSAPPPAGRPAGGHHSTRRLSASPSALGSRGLAPPGRPAPGVRKPCARRLRAQLFTGDAHRSPVSPSRCDGHPSSSSPRADASVFAAPPSALSESPRPRFTLGPRRPSGFFGLPARRRPRAAVATAFSAARPRPTMPRGTPSSSPNRSTLKNRPSWVPALAEVNGAAVLSVAAASPFPEWKSPRRQTRRRPCTRARDLREATQQPLPVVA